MADTSNWKYGFFLDHIVKRLENNDYYYERIGNKFVFYIGCPCKQEDPAVAYLSCEFYHDDEDIERTKNTLCISTKPEKTFLDVTSLPTNLFNLLYGFAGKYAKIEKVVFKLYLK